MTFETARIRLNRHDWKIIAMVSFFGTMMCISVTLAIDAPHFMELTGQLRWEGIRNDVMIPIILGPSFFSYLTYKIRALEHAKRELTRMATMDAMTGLLNRGAFAYKVQNQLSENDGSTSISHALFVLDIDHFKSVNDLHGHDIGDIALKEIATILSASIRPQDIAGRLGGEEFGIFLPLVDAPTARLMAGQLLRNVANIEFAPKGKFHPLSVSIGIAMAQGGTNFAIVYKSADEALYAAKNAGRNRVVEHRSVERAA